MLLGLSLPHYKLREVGKDSFQLENYAAIPHDLSVSKT